MNRTATSLQNAPYEFLKKKKKKCFSFFIVNFEPVFWGVSLENVNIHIYRLLHFRHHSLDTE